MGVIYNTSIVRSGLVLCLDAANRKSYPGSGTTWFDLSGIGNNVTAQGATPPSYNSSGFFSTGSVGYWFRASSTGVPVGNEQYTMQAWIRFSSWPNRGGIMSIGTYGITNQSNAFRTDDGTQIGEFLVYWWGNDSANVGNTANLSLNTWFLATTLFDGVNRMVIANNTIVLSTTPGTNVHNVTSSQLQIAATNSGGTEPLQGDIAAAMIYNRALTTNEIQQNFEAMRDRYGV